MDAPLFTTYLRKCDGSCSNGGLITFGGLDKEHCGRVEGWVAVNPNTVHWRFHTQGIQLGSYQSNEPMDAISDTGTSFIVGPQSVVNKLADAIGATEISGLYVLPCDKKFTLTLTIGGRKYPIPSNQLLLKEAGFCVLALSGSDDYSFLILGNPFVRSIF